MLYSVHSYLEPQYIVHFSGFTTEKVFKFCVIAIQQA